MLHFKYFYQHSCNTVFLYLKDEIGKHNHLLELPEYIGDFANSIFNESILLKARHRLIESAIDL